MPEITSPPAGSVRVRGGFTPDNTTIEVFTGAEYGWVTLRGVVAATWDCRADCTTPRVNTLTLLLEPMMAFYYESITGPEAVALRMVGMTDEMLEAAKIEIERRKSRG